MLLIGTCTAGRRTEKVRHLEVCEKVGIAVLPTSSTSTSAIAFFSR